MERQEAQSFPEEHCVEGIGFIADARSSRSRFGCMDLLGFEELKLSQTRMV